MRVRRAYTLSRAPSRGGAARVYSRFRKIIIILTLKTARLASDANGALSRVIFSFLFQNIYSKIIIRPNIFLLINVE